MIHIKRATYLFIILILAGGCSTETTVNNRSIIQEGDITTYENTLIAADMKEDIDDDGEIEHIKLLISPAPIRNPEKIGEYLWDDSHYWQLIVEDNHHLYALFEDHVQGLAELYIVNEGEDENTIMFETKGTTLSLIQYKYNHDGFFEKKVIYNEGPILNRSTMK
ncbi:hypothetical protein [Chengkuizengella axinellae]|uniref:Lipoprotein n=1 Tax=Chengkuizengella axinellae TaxID=3064388 RepID=A0ABT9J550_9BACL|nr:hypothetical protein [Chengkuizengella sp. 2205SS18-9]MDP5276727.1 hypothetical protein [Chengkuizengella sp. 2205SS18-9]